MEESNEIPSGITRRQALRRGLLMGTGVLWATPVVQIIGVSRAYAQTPSPVESGGGDGQQPRDENGEGNSTPGNDGSDTNVHEPSGDEVSGVQVQQTQTPSVVAQGRITETEAETIPLTGIEVLPLATLGGGLLAAGAASLKVAKQMEGSNGPSQSGPEPAKDG